MKIGAKLLDRVRSLAFSQSWNWHARVDRSMKRKTRLFEKVINLKAKGTTRKKEKRNNISQVQSKIVNFILSQDGGNGQGVINFKSSPLSCLDLSIFRTRDDSVEAPDQLLWDWVVKFQVSSSDDRTSQTCSMGLGSSAAMLVAPTRWYDYFVKRLLCAKLDRCFAWISTPSMSNEMISIA